LLQRVAAFLAARIPAMIALIVHEHFEITGEQSPKRKIGIDSEAVAVRQDQSQAIRIAMPAYVHSRTVRHREIQHGNRIRDMKLHGIISQVIRQCWRYHSSYR